MEVEEEEEAMKEVERGFFFKVSLPGPTQSPPAVSLLEQQVAPGVPTAVRDWLPQVDEG